MTTLIITQLILACFLVILILLQGSDNEGLGFGGGGTLGGMMSARGSSNLLSRLTAITATLFMIMSVVLYPTVLQALAMVVQFLAIIISITIVPKVE